MSSSLADREANLYLDFVLASLPEVIRHSLELEMNVQNYEFQTDFAKKYHGQGIEVGLRRALHTLLVSRGLPIDDAQRERIASCSDADVLESWIARSASAVSVDDILH